MTSKQLNGSNVQSTTVARSQSYSLPDELPSRSFSSSSAFSHSPKAPVSNTSIHLQGSPRSVINGPGSLSLNDDALAELQAKHAAQLRDNQIQQASDREELLLRQQNEITALDNRNRLIKQRAENLQNHEDDAAEAQQQFGRIEADVTREAIKEQQKYEAERLKEEHQTLLKEFLPAYAFARDPKLAIHKDPEENKRTPTILQQQVARAQANAELGVYMSFISDLDAKATFLQEYSAVKKQNTLKSADMMKKLAQQEWLKLGQPRHQAKTHETKRGFVIPVRKGGEPKFPVNEFKPILAARLYATEELLQQARDQLALYQAQDRAARNESSLSDTNHS